MGGWWVGVGVVGLLLVSRLAAVVAKHVCPYGSHIGVRSKSSLTSTSGM